MNILKKIKRIFCNHDWEVEHNYLYWWKKTCTKCGKEINR